MIFEVFYNPAREKSPPRDPLDVEGIYTYKGDLPEVADASGVSINVVVFPVKNNAHILY